jgi:VanZ family protein
MLGLIAIESTDLFSAAHTGSLLAGILRLLHVPESKLAFVNHAVRKIGHCVGYGFLSFLIFRAFRGTYRFFAQGYEGWISSRITPGQSVNIFAVLWQPYWAAVALIFTFIVATCDEVHQMGIPSRTGTWWDVGLDTTAALVIQVLIYFTDRAKADRMARGQASQLASSKT